MTEDKQSNCDPMIRRLDRNDAVEYRTLRLEGLLRHPKLFRVAVEDEESLAIGVVADSLTANMTLGSFLRGSLVGIGSLSTIAGKKLDHKALLYGMYVREEASGRGIGEAIVRSLIALSGSRYDSIQLTVACSNLRARELYERCGFCCYGNEERSFRVNDYCVDESLYRLKL